MAHCDAGEREPSTPSALSMSAGFDQKKNCGSLLAQPMSNTDRFRIALVHQIGSEVEQAYQRSGMFERVRAMMADWKVFVRDNVSNGRNVVSLGMAGQIGHTCLLGPLQNKVFSFQ
jgi:hypothetical protein